MLFFKEIKNEKFGDQKFKKFYNEECHICSATMKVIATIENGQTSLREVLKASDVLKQSYENLKNAEYCDPNLVTKLYTYLGLKEPDALKNCPRRK